MEDWEDFAVDSVVRGHHIYKSIWTPFLGEVLRVEMEERNEEDRYALALLKDGGVVVGHVPRSFSRTFYFFLRYGGTIECKVRGIESSELDWKCRARTLCLESQSISREW